MEDPDTPETTETTNVRPPSMLSAGFHLRFFPALLKSRFGNKVEPARTSFVSASFMQSVLVLFGAIAAAFIGAPLYPGVAGWLLFALAAAGVAYVIAISILEVRGVPPAYEGFLFSLFFFCLSLGLAAGALAGLREPTSIRVLYACAGVALGYWAGLLVGLYGQRLGFFAVMLYPLAVAGAVGALLPAILLLST